MKDLIHLPKSAIIDLLIQKQNTLNELNEQIQQLYQIAVPTDLTDRQFTAQEIIIILRNHIQHNT